MFSPDEVESKPREHAMKRLTKDARQVCLMCPVIAECANTALGQLYPWGVWAGIAFSGNRMHHLQRDKLRMLAAERREAA
ncbi:WhiB family transcriptional regulator [Gordonia sp. GW1C4-4]|uniref:WhiB family transcriptional regulator n=2 Tax=Gordonia tangerina TaxID=2911060 RepID=A0ABS9DNZ2_9ACTN|nr:WhiB family transcriptional regulator [Gordonia tangerina]